MRRDRVTGGAFKGRRRRREKALQGRIEAALFAPKPLFTPMGNLKKKRRLKMSKHKRRKRLKANRHKKRTWQK